MADETARFVAEHPRSQQLHERAKSSLLDGVPMNWMVRWAGPFPLFVEEAAGARFTCVDGHEYVDFCLGDTGAMAGHGPAPTVAAVERQLRRGITHMLPTEDAIWSGEELRGGSACRPGSSPCRQRMRTASRSASRATSPAGARWSSTTSATTAPSTKRSRSSTGMVTCDPGRA